MNLSGTSDGGWVVVDLRDVASAIAALRDAAEEPPEDAVQEDEERAERLPAR